MATIGACNVDVRTNRQTDVRKQCEREQRAAVVAAAAVVVTAAAAAVKQKRRKSVRPVWRPSRRYDRVRFTGAREHLGKTDAIGRVVVISPWN